MYKLYIWSKLQLRVKMEEEIYISRDRPRSTLHIFGLVVDRNRVDVVIESGQLHYSPPPEGASVEGRRQTFLAARQLGADSDDEEGKNEQIYLIFLLEAKDLQLEAEELQQEAEEVCPGAAAKLETLSRQRKQV